MPGTTARSTSHSRSRGLHSRALVLRAFSDPFPQECTRLLQLSDREWSRLLHWLDTSGLALYLYDRLKELQMSTALPAEVQARLYRNLEDNVERTRALIAESKAIHCDFQRAQLSYATLKGFSLWPSAVPKMELRSQLDLDFLIAERCAPEARRILEDRGYRLQAISGRTWEFKTLCASAPSLKDLYKAVPSYSVELHLEADALDGLALLARTRTLEFNGLRMPVLPPADLLLGQGIHLYKHVVSEFVRASQLVEFRRNVISWRDDLALWDQIHSIAADNPRAPWALGIVTLLATRTIGDFAPDALTAWTVNRIPAAARVWVEAYGSRSVLSQFPGSKLYLLLLRELENSGLPVKRPIRQILVPLKLPPSVVLSSDQDRLPARVRSYRHQFIYILFRMRFHVIEGFRYAWESIRWRRLMEAITSD